jgi:hypothetical protein
MVGGKVDDYWLPCREKAADVEKSAFAPPIPKHEAALGITSHRGILKRVVIESTLIGSRNRPYRPLANVVPAVSVRAIDDYGAIASLCKICLDHSITAVGVANEHSMVALYNVI